jgi:hypothetical protein
MRRCPTYLEFEIDFLLGNKEILILAADIHDSVLVLLCHKLCVAVGTSWERSHKSADEVSPDGGDRLGDVAFRADGRSREAGRHSTGGTLSRSGAGRALRGKTGSARRPGTRKPQCTA